MRHLNSNKDLKNAIQDNIALIDFHAPWCAPCISQKPIIEQLDSRFKGRVLIAEMNIDNHQDIAATLGIRSIPTLIIFQDNKEVKRFVGLQPESTLANELEQLAV